MTPRTDVFDELAAMFISDEGRQAKSSLHRACSTVELLVVGHLPVRAGYWLTPIVDAVARVDGPAALVRLDDDHPTMELLRVPHEHRDCEPSPDQMLREAVERAAPIVRTWVVRAKERIEPSELIEATPDRVTILSGTNSAAVVRGYEIIKSIHRTAARESRPLPNCGVAIVGAPDNAARDTFERLQMTAANQLGMNIELRCCMQRIDADVQSSGFVHFVREPSPPPADVAAWIRDAQKRPQQNQQQRASREPIKARRGPIETAEPVDGAAEMEELQWARSEDVADEMTPGTLPFPRAGRVSHDEEVGQQAECETGQRRHAGTRSSRDGSNTLPKREPAIMSDRASMEAYLNGGETAASRTIKLAPKPSMELEPKRPVRDTRPSTRGSDTPLAEFVDGLTPIEARCPRHEAVELAVDDDGNIHALARESHLRDLRAVEAWARDHCELLAMACSVQSVNINAAGRVSCHVFTETPASVSDLHHSTLHLHVLAPVEVEGNVGWYAAPLNEPGRRDGGTKGNGEKGGHRGIKRARVPR